MVDPVARRGSRDSPRILKRIETGRGIVEYETVGAGPPVVFVHGVLANGTLWRKVVDRMPPGFSYVVPNWPLGSHSEPMPTEADLSPPGLTALISEFCESLNLHDVVLVGNDTGGALCQLLATEQPSRLRGLVLTPCDAFDNFPPAQLFRALRLALRIPGGLRATAAAMQFPVLWGLPMTFGALARNPIDPGTMHSWWAPLRHDRSIRRDLAKVVSGLDSRYTIAAARRLAAFERPVLVVWSPQDPIFPFDHARRLTSLVPDGHLEVVDDSFGLMPLDQPEALADAIARFLAELKPARTSR